MKLLHMLERYESYGQKGKHAHTFTDKSMQGEEVVEDRKRNVSEKEKVSKMWGFFITFI